MSTPKNKTLILFAFVLAFVAVTFIVCENETTHKHKWEWRITVEPTTSAPGLETETCTECGATRNTREIPPLPPPDCDCNGILEECTCVEGCECEICEPLPPVCEHDWGDWVTTRDPTETESGEAKRTCKIDPTHVETKTISATGPAGHVHQWGPWNTTTPATCTTEGKETSICSLDTSHKQTQPIAINPAAHKYGDWITTKDPTETERGEAKRTCEYNPAHVETRYISATGPAGHVHQWGAWSITTPATCTTEGVETITCALDSTHKNTRPLAINPDAHSYGAWAVTTPATCSAPGMETRTCSHNSEHKDTQSIPIDTAAHTYGEWTVKTAATCQAAGVKERSCLLNPAHDKETDTIPIDPAAHNAGPWTTTPPPVTCTTAGREEIHCTRCNFLIQFQTIAALGHDYKEVIIPPTISAPGSRTPTCMRCGATGAVVVIPQLTAPEVPVSITLPTLPGTVETMGTNTFYRNGAVFTANQTVTWSIDEAGSLEGTSINAATGALAVNIADHGKTVTITATSPNNPSNSDSKTITVVSCLPSDFYGEWFMERTWMFGEDFTVIINAGSFKFFDSDDGYVYFSIDDWTAELNASHSPGEYPAGYNLSVTAIEQVNNLYPSLAAYILIYLNNDGQKLMNYIDDTYDREHEKVNSGPAYLTHITAVYNGPATIDASLPLDNLKNNLIVTAHYSDNTTGIIAAGNYTLDGTLVAPTSDIIVRYEGKTDTFTVNVTNVQAFPQIEMVLIGNGGFEMGKDLVNGDDGDVTPTHQVTLTENFYMGKYEVTQAQYQAVMGSLPDDLISHSYGKGDNYPVYYVSWYAAIVFCNKLSMMEGLTPAYSISGSTDPAVWGPVPSGNNNIWNAVVCDWNANGYRLPTEAQWEYAAKGGNPLATGWVGYTYAGSDTIGNVAWYTDNSGSTTHEVGTKSPNGLGLYDMSGNVTEWCWDWYGNYANGAVVDPKGAAPGDSRVWRNGGMFSGASYCRSVSRGSDYPYFVDHDQGFRVSRPAP